MLICEYSVMFLWKPLLPTDCYQVFYAVVSPKHTRLHPNAMDYGVWLSPVSKVQMGYAMCSLAILKSGDGQQSKSLAYGQYKHCS